MRSCWLLGALVCGSCYQTPGVQTSSDIISVAASPDSAIADGRSQLTITATIDGKTDSSATVTFATSDGAFDFAEPDSPKTLQRVGPRIANSDTDKLITATLTVGRTPGILSISGKLGEFVSETTVEIEAAPPTSLVVDSSINMLRLNGTDRATLSVHLLRDPGLVSLGTRIAAKVCCPDPGGVAQACAGRDPLRAPAIVELTTGSTVELDVVAESMQPAELEKLGSSEAYVLLAPSAEAPLTCHSPEAGEVAQLVRFSLALPPAT